MMAERERMNKRMGLLQAKHDASAFIRIPWSGAEDTALEAAVHIHGTRHWAGLAKDKRFLVLAANHTVEDMASRWAMLDARRRRRKPPQSSIAKLASRGAVSAPLLPGGAPDIDAIAVARLTDVAREREARIAALAARLDAEARRREEAEARATASAMESEKLEESLRGFSSSRLSVIRGGSAASIVSAGRADAAALGALPGTARSRALSGAPAPALAGGGGGSVIGGGSVAASRAASALGSARSRLSAVSEAVERSQDTRRRARRVLESLKEELQSDAKSQ